MIKLNDFSAWLFDFDGVVVDSSQLHLETWQLAYREVFNSNMKKYESDKTSGISPKEIAAFLAKEAGYPDKIASLLNEKEIQLIKSGRFPELLPGAKDLFNLLSKENIPYAIVSNAHSSYVKRVSEYHKLKISNIFGLEDFSKPKPDKDPYVSAALSIGLDSSNYSNCVVFEDSIPGVVSAKSAGMIAVGVLTKHSTKELCSSGADFTIQNLNDYRLIESSKFSRSTAL